MILYMIAFSWLVFGTFLLSLLLLQNARPHEFLGITFSSHHAKDPQVRRIIRSFKLACVGVFGFFVILSLVLLRRESEFAEGFMLLLVIGNMVANGLLIDKYQKSLRKIKTQNNWVYPKSHSIQVDLSVSKEKGKANISAIWLWLLFVLSLMPGILLIINPQPDYPLMLGLMGPVIQLPTIFLFYQGKDQNLMVVKDEPALNLLLAQKSERVNSIAATLMALLFCSFWWSFHLFLWSDMKSQGMVMVDMSLLNVSEFDFGQFHVLAAIFVLIAGLLAIAFWQQRQAKFILESVGESMAKGKLEEPMVEREATFKWGAYHNRLDQRIFVPKRVASMGWTINVAHPIGKAIYLGTMGLVVVLLGFVLFSGMKDYEVTFYPEVFEIDAAMYDVSIDKADVVSIEVINVLPKGRRTNGFGGTTKSFGHFNLEGYGDTRLFVYHNVKQYIVVKRKGDSPSYVIFNGKSEVLTKKWIGELHQWLDE